MPAAATTDLRRRSLEVIRAGQAPSGAYVACPSFPVYGYAWLRDGAFVADTMSRAGEVESAEAFFDWALRIAVERDGRDLAARYTLDGGDDPAEWPQRQWDGWGLLLWALAQHCDRHGVSRERWTGNVELVAQFLESVWRTPCTDWWEERQGLHATTLGCIAAGLLAWDVSTRGLLRALDDEADWRLDASLLALVHPLGLVDPERVVPPIEDRLISPGGGVHRHLQDTYYGGGEWVLLTALHGWVLAEIGAIAEARAALNWVAAHTAANGELPEQSQDYLLAPEEYEPWVARWGLPPSPLLWSHAMFLDLAIALDA